MTKIKFKWESISTKLNDVGSGGASRVKVIGGWIVLNETVLALPATTNMIKMSCSQSMIFIPDPNHEWEIE